MKRPALIALLIAPASAFAWDSTPQELPFHDETDVFSAAEFDTGALPQGSPLTVRFFIDSTGGSTADVDAESGLHWPDPLEWSVESTRRGGFFALVTDLTMQAEVGVDIFGYQGTFPVWSDGLYMHDESHFDGLLLADGAPSYIDLSADGQGIDPLTYTLSIFTGVDLQFTLEAYPRAEGHLEGLRIEAGEAVILAESESTHMDVPEENPGYLDLAVTYVAALRADLQIVFVPALAIGTPFGSFEVLSFEIPVDMITYDEERPFTPIDIQHPLPSLSPPLTTYSFGEVEVGNLANGEFALADVGLMDLEGTAHIEGDAAFTVYPQYFYATPGNEDGVVVTFAPTEAGEFTALLVIESSDPVRPRLEIPLIGTGFSDDPGPGDVISEDVKTCGCASTDVQGWPIGAALLAMVGARRYRSRRP